MKKLGSTCLCTALVLFCASAIATPARADVKSAAPAVHRAIHAHSGVIRARAFTARMAQRSNHVHRWLWRARLQHNLVRTRCLNVRLSQLHAIERIAQASRLAIEAAARINGLTGYHMVKLVHLHDSSQANLEAASRCGYKRTRTPTTYSVRVIREPTLYDAPTLDSLR